MFSVIKDGREKSFKTRPNEMERIYLIIFMAWNGDTVRVNVYWFYLSLILYKLYCLYVHFIGARLGKEFISYRCLHFLDRFLAAIFMPSKAKLYAFIEYKI